MLNPRSIITTLAFLGFFGLGLVTSCAAPVSGSQLTPTATIAPAAALATSTPTTSPAPAAATPVSQAQSAAKLNLNTATDAQLLAVPNVGSNMLREFREYRPYASIEQFRRELGKYISADQIAAYEKYVYVPVDPSAATAATIQQLPGVDASIAQQLIAGQPYASNDAFLAKLGQLVSAEQAAAARAYLK